MCQCLNIPRSSYHHYKAVVLVSEAQLEENFRSLEELTLKTKDYVHWWNHYRIHSTLNYQTPMTKRAIV